MVDGLETGNVSSRLPISDWASFLIDPMLSEDASQVNLPGLCFAIGLLGLASSQFLRNHRHPGAISTHIHDGGLGSLALAWFCRPFLPLLGGATDPLNYPLDLTGRDRYTAGLFQMPLGFEIGGLIGSLQAEQFG